MRDVDTFEVNAKVLEGRVVSFTKCKDPNCKKCGLARESPLLPDDQVAFDLLDDLVNSMCADVLEPVRDGNYRFKVDELESHDQFTLMDFPNSGIGAVNGISESLPSPTGMQTVISRHGFPGFWELLGYLFSRVTRERIYEPSYNDLISQHLKARKYQGRWQKRWLWCCFATRTIAVILECMWADWKSLICAACAFLVPAAVRKALKYLLNS